MESAGPIAEARADFAQFVGQYDTRQYYIRPDTEELDYLQEYLDGWLEDGDAVAVTGRSFETYLRACIDIADAVFRDTLSLDYKGSPGAKYKDAYPRRVSAIHEPGLGANRFTERAHYEIVAYRKEIERLNPSSDND